MSHRIVGMRRSAICREFLRGEVTEADSLREAIGAIPTAPDQAPESKQLPP